MKKLTTTIAALAALGFAIPASAQSGWEQSHRHNGYDQNEYRGGGIDARIDQLQQRLQMGVQRGTISRREAEPLRQQLRQLRQLDRQYSRDGLSRNERQALQQRIQSLQVQIRSAERSGNRWDGDRRYDNEREGRYYNDNRNSDWDRDDNRGYRN